MKTTTINFDNKVTAILKKKEDDGKEVYLTYADIITTCCDSVSQQGCPISEQRIRMKLQDACEKAAEKSDTPIKIDRTWIPILKKAVADTSFTIVHKDLVAFGDKIESLVQ